jgi:chorismate-pyruvate lyase
MMLTITLDEAMTVQLRQQAAARQVSMEECAMQLLSEAVAQLADTTRWQQYNQRRVALIHKSAITSLSREEAAELEALQAALDQRLTPMDEQLLTVVADMQRTVAALPDNAQQ